MAKSPRTLHKRKGKITRLYHVIFLPSFPRTILILSSLIADNIGSGKGGSVTIVRALTAHKYV